MAKAPQSITIEIRTSQTLRIAINALVAAKQIAEIIPEWNQLERDELLRMIDQAIEAILDDIDVR